MKRHNYSGISEADIARAIDSWVHKERDRKVMRRALLDGIHYESLAEEFNISVTTIKRIIYKHEYNVFIHAQKMSRK